VPSTYLLVGLAKVEFADNQRFTIKWTVLTTLIMLLVNLALGVIPLVGPTR
jgi:CitMHS family citrate-Mg2+:H+ or citrate-Ca2+:H+ symporter